DGRVDLWSSGSQQWIRGAVEHKRGVYAVAFSPDDKQLASASADQSVYIDDVARFGENPKKLVGYADEFFSVDFETDNRLATGTADGPIILWDLSEPVPIARPLDSGTDARTEMVFAGDGKTLAWYSRDSLKFLSVENTLA